MFVEVRQLMSFALTNLIYTLDRTNHGVKLHPRMLIFVMLAGLMLIGSLLAGYGMASRKSRNWMHTVAFAVILALTVYVIRDLEFSSSSRPSRDE
mgnify:CR=1 FL=1